jgi:hypothetical protein
LDSALSLYSVVVAAKEQVSCSLGEESAILNMKNSVYYGMESVGARIWNLLRQPRTVREIRDAMLEEYNVEPERCERDLLEFLRKMKAEGLIDVEGEHPEMK